jgi:hypothetical protein
MDDAKADQIPQIITSAFIALGTTDPIVETILLNNKYYVGRKFSAGGYAAVWFTDNSIVKLFNQEGQLLMAINLDEKLGKAA